MQQVIKIDCAPEISRTIRDDLMNILLHARQFLVGINDDILKTVHLVVLNARSRMLQVRQQGVQHLVVLLLAELFRDDDCFDVDLLEAVIQFGQLISRVHRHL